MPGKLLLVTGLSGSGKSTLIAAALQAVPDLIYLRTYTTRPPRPGEETSHEYTFVSLEEYIRLRASSLSWDHTEYAGYAYGADITDILHTIQKGGTVICGVAPSPDIIAQVRQLYGVESKVILVDTPQDIAAERIAGDAARSARRESLTDITADSIFTPLGTPQEDLKAFCLFIKNMIR